MAGSGTLAARCRGDPSSTAPAATRAEWFRCFLDGYGLARAARADLVERILRFAITDNGWYARTQGFTREARNGEGLWTLARQSRAALCTLEHRDLLTRASPAMTGNSHR
ncbi:hypothetical protein [Plantactinospora sp. KLBMP9567]|uniref:hypothetical protein n=1 Tax=Plantactinospora sp. KLBMP9567 TaxID=3085900 RepID=UPI002981A2CF|nr:hypothetical protein [Plantactinospora sp. KLBMP9567]MDW5326697.1 hypothetical protein [Plantactinospora sp. KLBMP9567]